MFKGLAWLHAHLFRLCLWLLTLPFKALWSTLGALLALLGEETQRWTGITVSGLMIFAAGKATLLYAPISIKKPLVLVVLVLVLIWAFAAKRAAHYTMHNDLFRVRQRKAFREVAGNVRNLRREVTDRMARAAEGTPVGGMFRTNREKTEQARQADADREVEAEQRRRELAEEPDPAIWEWI